MDFNMTLATRICIVGLVALLCLFGGCANDTEKNNIKLRQRIEDFTGTVASLRSENADLQVSIDQTAKSMTDHKNENIELRKQIKELKWSVAVLTKENTLLRKRLGIDDPGSRRKPDRKIVYETKKAKVPAASPGLVASWRGSGIKTTEPFTITKSPWAIVWSSSPGQYGGFLSISVNKANGEMISLAANTTKAGSDTSYVYDTGVFHLEINSANTDWTIKIHQAP